MKILVTGIGGMVGQGVLKNIRRTYNHRFIIVGTDTSLLTPGNHMCDRVYKVPPAYYQDYAYVSVIKQLCKEENIQLIIPTTDWESYILARSRVTELYDIAIAASPIEIALMGLDKYRNYQLFKQYGIPFAESRLPTEYTSDFEHWVIKPRKGRGSQGVMFDGDYNKLDDSYIIQELLTGDELTIAFYVKKNGDLHGFIVFRRELKDGYSNRVEVVFDYNPQIEKLIKKMIYYFPFRGSINIQAKVREGVINPFELNCRFSGTNGLRSRFGFNDVKYTIQEYLLGEEPSPVNVLPGCAMRIIQDLIYPERTFKEITHESENYIF